MSGSIRPRKSGKLLLAAEGVERLGLDGGDQRVGIALEQLAADQQDELLLAAREAVAERRPRAPSSSIGGSWPSGWAVPRVSQNARK